MCIRDRLSGIQPAVVLSAFQPLNILKGNTFTKTNSKSKLRNTLVVVQFACSVLLVIGTLTIMQQMDFIKQSKLGYEKDHIFSFWTNSGEQLLTLKNELEQQASIEGVTISNRNITDANGQIGGFTYEGMPEGMEDYTSIYDINVSHNYKDFYGLALKEGRWFLPNDKDEASVILNETAVDKLQLEDPIGKWIDLWGQRVTIVGIVKDFHFRSLHHPIEGLMFSNRPNYFYCSSVKTTAANATEAIAATEKVFKKLYPNNIFSYEFLDESFDKLYKRETRISQIFQLFALLTLFLSCLGIFGLITYTAERRGKEIGIRKVLGASVFNIVQLLSSNFLKLIGIALVIALPIGWYLTKEWLNTFAYRMDMGWGLFGLTAILILLIALATISVQSIRAALINPTQTLKNE